MFIFVSVKHLVSYIIISVLLLQTVGNSYFFLEYQYSIEKYKSSCENKDKPEMKCHGQCQMKKQTRQFGFWENENQKNHKIPSLKTVKSFDSFNDMREYTCCYHLSFDDNSYFVFMNSYSYLSSSQIHPPPELV